MRIDKLEKAYDIDVELVHFPLHPDTPIEGSSLEDLFAGRGVDIDAMYVRMKGLMEAEGLPYGKRDWFSAFAIPHKSSQDKGISISVMNINLEKWFVRSTVLAKNIIEFYYKEIRPLGKVYLSSRKLNTEI